MKSAQCQVSFCSRCRFYTPEGRRGGQCGQLGVPVEGRWMPCALAVPTFASAMVEMKPLDFLPQPVELKLVDLQLETARLEAALEAPAVEGHPDHAIHLEPANLTISQ